MSGGQPERLPGEKLPAAVLLGPHLQHTDARRAGLSICLGLCREDVAGDGIVADDGNARLRQGYRLIDGLLTGDDVDELPLRFNDAAGVSIAQLVGYQGLEASLIG